ncbi:MAG: acyl-CoA dehydrogenase family protein [Myxococcota bacterium]
MDFGLSEEQQLLQESIGQFLAKENDATRLRARFDAEEPSDPALWRGMAELGLAGLAIPEAHGGAGLALLDAALVAEVLGRNATPGPFLGHTLASLALVLAGSPEQQARWLPRLATGDAVGTIAFAEPDGGWQPEEWHLAVGDTLSGAKAHVPNASHADLIVVGLAGGALAIVEREARGVVIEPFPGVDRTRRLDALRFEGAPCELLSGGSGAASRVRDAALVLLAADAFGGASTLLEMTVEYAKTREQFGVTIGHFQALKHQLANMALEVEPGRGLYWYAAHAFDEAPDESPRMAALAKAHLTDRFLQISRDAVEAHGGIGYTWECDVQIWFKRAIFDRSFLGSPGVHRERAAQLAGW